MEWSEASNSHGGPVSMQSFVLVRSGHHANHWLSVIGEPDQVMPILLRYLNRTWGKEIAERASGLDFLPNRMHLSLGKVITGDLVMAKITLGCACFMYIILSSAQRAELHSAYPVLVSKLRKTFGVVVQQLEWHNRIETVMNIRLEGTTDALSVSAVEAERVAASAGSNRDETKMNTSLTMDDPRAMSLTNALDHMTIDASPLHSKAGGGGNANAKTQSKSKVVDSCKPQPLWSASDLVLPCFAIDFVSKRDAWEGKPGTKLELFITALASILIRNPQHSLPSHKDKDMQAWSLDIPSPNAKSRSVNNSANSIAMVDDEDEQPPVSVVPDIAGPGGKMYPYANYQHRRGVITNEGSRKENRPCYVQGECISVRELEGYVFSKKAYIITIRLEQRRKIDLDIWVLAKHILDGAATLKPGSGQGPSIPAATSIPVPGDLVFADVSVQAALAHGIGLDLDALNASNGDDKSARAASVSLTSTSAAASSFAGQKIKR